MTFVDSNIPMYLVGAEHPNKQESRRQLDELIHAEERLVTDAEVLQEILHRYVAINRRDAVQPAFDALLRVVDEVLPIELPDVERAKSILLERTQLSARDSIHIAIIERHRVEQILTFDRGFEAYPGLRRLPR